MAALVWLVAGVLLIAVEVLSGDLVLLMLGVGALAAAGSSALGAPLLVDVLVFALASLGLITVARPALRRRLQPPELVRTNVEALVGGTATVVSTVDSQGGRVRIGGDVWSARAYDPTEVLEPGRTVTVMEISGATAVVWGGP
ncbi:Membrane protein implicated in regulation of membrane protease activity [Streptoalloteichus tenebrarius]|uniref:Membrane protein implicated in regulation of membrane protease activity n=1 Tax=Streptoalloteichus tenebrarius (strain ATCC 17920 / DSM 40477 / JCM 4838 / CBS 697.72 / NBRC 16177 / NCIMB 11028 / NRRL B-12390 / A12253. 1 / ISP 5477) TaxID=1933 RepID=A0ABT1I148_STRSD|nr:NfeD family protein [Streptoalloteichus tenebrarius]MCP2261475.1 Membrane protein implicated in regulation of membrane protease activity [Streptoalloteichus tenebrarius]BFE99711.1 NfeD family protein [Streptoalloteichus tenebrarius]